LVVQIGEARFVVDWRVKPVELVGHVRMTLLAVGVIVSRGWVLPKLLHSLGPQNNAAEPRPRVIKNQGDVLVIWWSGSYRSED